MKETAELAFPFILVIIGIILIILIVPPMIKYHIVRVVLYKYNTENSQLVLMALLSSTCNGKSISQIIVESGLNKNHDNLKCISEKLNLLIPSKCYKLLATSKVLVESGGCNPEKFSTSTDLPVPYNPKSLKEKVTLVIN